MSAIILSFCKYSLSARDVVGPAGDGRGPRPRTWQCDQGLVPRTQTPERRAACNLQPRYPGVSWQPLTWFLGGGGSAVAGVPCSSSLAGGAANADAGSSRRCGRTRGRSIQRGQESGRGEEAGAAGLGAGRVVPGPSSLYLGCGNP